MCHSNKTQHIDAQKCVSLSLPSSALMDNFMADKFPPMRWETPSEFYFHTFSKRHSEDGGREARCDPDAVTPQNDNNNNRVN